MKIAISAESSIDLTQELLDKFDIKTTPFGINFNNKLVEDRIGISSEIFEYVSKSKVLPKTSAVAPEQYKDHFDSLLKEYDAIIHFSISSFMSSAFNNARIIANEMQNVYVVDTKTLSTGIALLAIYARELADSGKSADEIYQLVNARVENVQASFIPESLNYLHKGGRCNALTLLGANLLKIKPQISVKDGRMGVDRKYRGQMTKVITTYCDDVIAEYPNADKKYAFVTHSSPMPEVEQILESKLKNAGFETVFNTTAGGTICSHCGPATIGVLFLNK